MATEYEVWIADQFGDRIAVLDAFESLQWARQTNGIGQFAIRFDTDKFDINALWGVDRRIEIWRRPENGPRSLEMIGFLRYRKRETQVAGGKYITIGGPDQVDLLRRRIVAADAGSAGAEKTAEADDMMKEYVYEALGGGAGAGRNITALGFSIQADLTAAPSIDKAAARRNLLKTLQEIAKTSYYQGTPLYFDVITATTTTFEFRTYTNQRGQDRTTSGTNPVTLSAEHGTLQNPVLTEDWRSEATFVYAAGQGIKAARVVQTVEDTARTASSIFNRQEALFDGKDYEAAVALNDAGENYLRSLRPRRSFKAQIVNTTGNRMGKDWYFGDKVTAVYEKEQFDALIEAISATVTSDGETIDARIEYD